MGRAEGGLGWGRVLSNPWVFLIWSCCLSFHKQDHWPEFLLRISGANLIQLLSCLVWFKQFLAFEELRNKTNPKQLPLFGQFHCFEIEILNIALVNCENQFYCLSVPTRWPTDLLLTSSCCFFNSNSYFFLYSFLCVWSIYRTPYLFQLYIFVVTFLFKEFIKA